MKDKTFKEQRKGNKSTLENSAEIKGKSQRAVVRT